ncbi:hypothetical protein B0A48_08799 [Cryoendolithus antarcticus]|uniref:GRF-type domain-containing protein n=1 Tax=Cryoendolithus antarcticus TaxID=1507870 RepID=A0A1V8T4P1_9PEZI|nr:hypothetical protein B0A48_08799 [Cryoendolithus antarcticus]
MFRGRSTTRGSSTRGSRGNSYARRGGAPKRTSGLKGLFADGIWQCNCDPRLPAEHFRVKKEGKNQGRWFYTCQNSEPQRCGFFLWDEDAKIREEGAVLGNSRTEPEMRREAEGQMTWGPARGGMFGNVDPISGLARTQREMDDDESTEAGSPPPLYSTQPAVQAANKRSATTAGFGDNDDDDFLDWPLTGQDEDAMAKAADAATSFTTPHKAQKQGVYDTPATTTEKAKRHLPWLAEASGNAQQLQSDYFNIPSKPSVMPPLHFPNQVAAQAGPQTPSIDPVLPLIPPKAPSPPTRHVDPLLHPASTSDLAASALSILSNTIIPPEPLAQLRALLNQHDLKTQGIIKGRDITRLGLKAKDARIAELQARIASLEAEREVDRGVIRSLRWQREVGGTENGDGEEL